MGAVAPEQEEEASMDPIVRIERATAVGREKVKGVKADDLSKPTRALSSMCALC